MDCCSKYSDYTGTHPMASRVGDGAVLSAGPPNRIAPNVTLLGGHRHQQSLRYAEHHHRLAALHSSERLYQQQQHAGFERYLPPVSYSSYHPVTYGAAGLGYGNLGRRDTPTYLNHPTHHSQHSHHLYHPPHFDSTYNGRMIGGGGGGSGPSLSYQPYGEVYENRQTVPSSVLHYTARNSAFQYGRHLPSASPAFQQSEYLHYYPYQSFGSDQRYDQYNLHSINEQQLLSSKDHVASKEPEQHIRKAEAAYAQQHGQSNLPSLASLGITMTASPMASGSTTTDSGISGSSRCGSTPISMATTSTGYSGEYSLAGSNVRGLTDENATDAKDGQRSLPTTPEIAKDGRSSIKDHPFSPQATCIKSPSSPSESEKVFSGKLCASSRQMDCLTPMISTPERCGTPFIPSIRPSASFQSPQRYQSTHNKWSPNYCDRSETPSFSPKPFIPKAFSPKPRKKQTHSSLCTPNTIQSETKKNRVVECDLIPSKKSKRRSEQPQMEDIREEIRDIKPLPGFQQAFGTTEIGRFFETFLNIPASPYDSVYSYESEADTMSPQPWELDNSVDGSQYDVQISASLQSVYKNSLGEKNYLSGIRCNGY